MDLRAARQVDARRDDPAEIGAVGADMVKGRRGAKADDKLVPVRSDRLRRNGVAGAVSADRLRLVDLQRDAPRHPPPHGDHPRHTKGTQSGGEDGVRSFSSWWFQVYK